MKYWINTVSRDHVLRGRQGGFTQANHGKPHGLRRMAAGDWIIFYSPRTAYQGGESFQAFTAAAQVAAGEPYQVEMAPDFMLWRRDVIFQNCSETPIRPLIDDLSFIEDKQHWGYRFRFGLFEIPEPDFRLIAAAIGLTID